MPKYINHFIRLLLHLSYQVHQPFSLSFVDDLSGKKLVCHLYDYDQFVKTDKIGFVQLRLSTIPRNEKMSVQKHIDRCEHECHTHDEVCVLHRINI